MAHAYAFGIEEEFFLADARTRGTARRGLRGFHAAVKARLDDAEREMLQSQIETASPPLEDVAAAEAHLRGLRAGLAEIGRAHGVLVFAAGTHPTATWRGQRESSGERYRGLMRELRMIGERNVVCGMHVHVSVRRPDDRIGLQNRLLPFLPVLLALSTSSPFWQGRRTGLAGYRMRAYAELPRTGLPELFDDEADFARYLRVMTASGAIADASHLWWHLRASSKYPTLELRVADACPRLPDALCIASLFRCLVRRLDRDPGLNAGLTGASRGLVMENLWRAGRDGTRAALIDEARARAVPLPEAVEGLLDLVAEDAGALGCAQACAHARAIAAGGSAADAQVGVYEAARRDGGADKAALAAVVDWLAARTAGEAEARPGGTRPSRARAASGRAA